MISYPLLKFSIAYRQQSIPTEVILRCFLACDLSTCANCELLKKYPTTAEKADGHAIDVERLSEVWPEEKALK
ncbi:hypothetical protein E0H83_01130 [Acinetobacter terrestris]|uniref:hypothetical protein n=1 Tax=Acinetobacter terrestris TaxID=2529843 RepID=UPI001039B770|nr:hypothetical protein [Acinetobacter terrestris]TCB48373.1 hypothetical protein E0H83_01130 [Acinetobacter terrestris]